MIPTGQQVEELVFESILVPNQSRKNYNKVYTVPKHSFPEPMRARTQDFFRQNGGQVFFTGSRTAAPNEKSATDPKGACRFYSVEF